MLTFFLAELSQITERLGPVEQKITQAIEAMDKISSK